MAAVSPPLAIRRAFVEVGGRLVHLRIGGQGAPLLLLHQSPRSSAELEPLIREWGAHFTCIAPDMPGLGLSEPLAVLEPSMADLARELIALLDALGLHEVAAYGFHTGAALAVTAAAQHPERFTAIVANGFACWTPAEVEDFLSHYLPPFSPEGMGTHLPFWWTRMRDQRLFFPWFRLSDNARLPLDVASPAEIHEQLMDVMRAGDSYRGPYGAAFRTDRTAIERLKIPALLVGAANDPLTAHQSRFPALPEWVDVQRLDHQAACRAAALALLQRNRPRLQTLTLPSSALRGYVSVAAEDFSGDLHWLAAPGDGPVQLLIPPPGSTAALALRAARRIDPAAQWLALDLPGHGASDPWPESLTSLNGLADVVKAAASALEVERLVAQGDSAVVALAAASDPYWQAVRTQSAVLPLDLASHGHACLPDRTPDPAGAHLLRTWQAVRDGALFWPWYKPTAVHARPLGPLDPETLNLQQVALFDAQGVAPLLALLAQADLAALLGAPQGQVTWGMPLWAAQRPDVWRPVRAETLVSLHLEDD
jgi:pimeloyl-ACP methyl ester carboxylesterase